MMSKFAYNHPCGSTNGTHLDCKNYDVLCDVCTSEMPFTKPRGCLYANFLLIIIISIFSLFIYDTCIN